ncbi:MAG: helix-turn-helix transcriptional regulator [Prosthecobacter sp.]|uniref:helix-turn-helix domain-containing protein n=1 Tax=Prosthecobacter sp. TaxID=1965333 RepID=UPI0025EE66C3|nr:helix-turn-helix transcriptional regulator [Prosthecobacter sp.]MCF7786818.1 helix-turn-helix transcriptional regulator [Prosthecobacter sp.]
MANPSLSSSFGAVIRARRIELGLTQEQVAEFAGIHPTYVGMVERAERNCSVDIAQAISAALELPLSKLIALAEVALKAKATARKAKRA